MKRVPRNGPNQVRVQVIACCACHRRCVHDVRGVGRPADLVADAALTREVCAGTAPRRDRRAHNVTHNAGSHRSPNSPTSRASWPQVVVCKTQHTLHLVAREPHE
jgi:hypothetical protein